MFNGLVSKAKLFVHRRKWRKLNSHNFTSLKNDFDFDLAEVGNFSYGDIKIVYANKVNKLKIGHFCSIADDVKFMLNADHPTNLVSTYPFKAKVLNDGTDAISKGDIEVGDDVWIGYNSLILSGVKIGQGAVVAAGSVVTKDVPPYAIVGGVPAKVIKYRFDEKIIKKLMNLDYGKLTADIVKNNKDLFYQEMTVEVADKMLELFGKTEGDK